ncbi:hypothetical protein ACE6H2_022712 [Prunus campanulata]
MAPNRPSSQDEPLEEVEASSEEEVDGEEEEESGSEPESEPELPTAPIPVAEKKQPPKNPDLATVPQSSSPGSEEEVDGEEEEESGSESEEPEPALAEKKPDSAMEETPKTKKPKSKASATTTLAARAGSKRPSESDPKDSKRPKKKKISDSDQKPDHAGAGGDDSKKLLLLQRIWSDDDEITILEGMIDYYTKQGVHPNADMFAFHDFMKKSLKADVNKTQLQDKIRRLKKKYESNVDKGKKYNPVKPHELKVFDLSKKVWGRGEGLFAVGELSEEYKCNETCEGLREQRLLEGCLGLIGEPKRTELNEEWKKLNVTELELVVRRSELMRDKAKLMSDKAKLILKALK